MNILLVASIIFVIFLVVWILVKKSRNATQVTNLPKSIVIPIPDNNKVVKKFQETKTKKTPTNTSKKSVAKKATKKKTSTKA